MKTRRCAFCGGRILGEIPYLSTFIDRVWMPVHRLCRAPLSLALKAARDSDLRQPHN